MPTTHGIEIVVEGGIPSCPFRGLDSPLGHHGIGIAVPKLVRDDDLCPVFLGHQCGGRTGPASTDDQYVRFMSHLGEINHLGINPAPGLQEVDNLVVNGIALVGPDPNLPSGLLLIVRMICPQPLLPLREGKGRELLSLGLSLQPSRPRLLHLPYPFPQFRCVRHSPFPNITFYIMSPRKFTYPWGVLLQQVLSKKEKVDRFSRSK